MTTAATSKRVPDINAEISSNGLLHISFASGDTVVVDPSRLDLTIRSMAILHGLKQKLVDAAAIGRDMVTGRSATASDKQAAVMEVYNRIVAVDGSATWNKVRDSSTGGTGGLLVAALMKLTGKDKTFVTAFLAAKSNEEKTALRRSAKVVEVIATLQAAKVSDVDTDALLGELSSMDDTEGEGEGEEPNGMIDLT